MVTPGLPDVDFTRFARQRLGGPIDALLDQARGDTLDLSPRRQLAGEGVTWAPRRRDEPDDMVFATVVSVLRTTIEPTVEAYAERLAALVDPKGGQLLFVEPTRSSGVGARIQRLWRPATEVSANLRVHHGFRLALWRAGLTVFRVERHDLPRRAWPLSSVALGMARHTPNRADGSPPASMGR